MADKKRDSSRTCLQVASVLSIRCLIFLSIISTKKVKTFSLLQLRDPWGAFDWSGEEEEEVEEMLRMSCDDVGDWSTTSPLWKQHPNVAKACNFDEKERGYFWMEMKVANMRETNIVSESRAEHSGERTGQNRTGREEN
eukprot:760560-Hanusia_phi.AAC.2